MRRVLVIALALLAASIDLAAKGVTVKLTLTGPGLAHAVEIVEPDVLSDSNVWDGGFLGAELPEAPALKGVVHTLTFDVRLPEWMRQGVKTLYVVSVARHATNGELLLHLPGRGEPGYALNVRTILRETRDGRWHRPSRAWAAAIDKYVP